MELVSGCRNQADLKRIQTFLTQFPVTWPEAQESQLAYDLLIEHRLRDGLTIPDALIAAMALTRAATLYTFNLKHFSPIRGLQVATPYVRPSEAS